MLVGEELRLSTASVGMVRFAAMPRNATVTIPASLRRDLVRVCKATGADPDRVASAAVRREVALREYNRVMRRLRAEMRRRGFGRLSEEEILRAVS